MSLVITGVFDGPLTGGVPKGIELYVSADIADLSIYGVGAANNGGGTDGEEFTFPAVAAAAGTYIYVSSEAVQFANFFGFAPDYTSGILSINGDDAIELFENGTIIDTFGDPNVDGSGQVWEYLDGWASRNPGTAANPTFDAGDWTFSGPNALDGETTNAAAATSIPVAIYDSVTPPTPDPVFVINEIDVDQASTDTAEFVEIYDGGVGNAALDGLSLVFFNGNGDAEYDTISLDGLTTNEDGYFVVGSADVANVDLIAFTSNALQNGADAVGLYTGIAPATATTENLVDAIVYGTADADDVELLSLLGQSTQYDEDANEASETDALARDVDGTGDFTAQAPTPGETNVVDTSVPPQPTEITLISAIQGEGGTQEGAVAGVDDVSAFDGQFVTVSAIVTADFQDGLFGTQGDQNGFYIQEEEIDYDLSDLSSEGIFIFDGTAPLVDVQIGDLVEITGTVSEFFGQTQISATSVTVVASEQTVPDAVEVTFPTATVMDDGSGNLVANLEAFEGMLVTIGQDLTVSELFNLDRFGDYTVTSDGRIVQFSQDNAPDTEGYAEHLRDSAARTLLLGDGISTQNPAELQIIDGNDGILTAEDSFRIGDTISDITGVVNYAFGEFQINSPEGVYEQTNERPDAPEDIGGNFTVASLNVLNYFTTIDETGVFTDNGSDPRGADTVEEFDRQAERLVTAIVAMDADVLGLVEIENDFAGDTFAIADIVGRVNAELGSEVYAFVDPGQEFVGGDAIANALIYKVDEVGLQGDLAILTEFEGRDFLDPLGAGRDLNRAAIAQTFEDLSTGQTLTVSVNHLKSKGSLTGLDVDEDQLDGQGNNNATRTEAADILAAWLENDPTGQGSENTLILGDLNAYANEDPLTTLAEAGYVDLAAQELGDEAYSFVFDGQIGTLDYALANASLAEDLVGVTEWHVNADEADALDYNLDFGRDASLFDGDSPARNSDHDPVLVSFQFEPIFNLFVGTEERDRLDGTSGADSIEALGGSDFIFAGAGDDSIAGGDGNDVIRGGAGDDLIFGGAGNDAIRGGAGADTLSGDDGSDTLQYVESDAGVNVDLNADLETGLQAVSGGDAEGDIVEGFEGVRGSDFEDILLGNDEANVLRGEAGDDVIIGGAGNDTIRGGAGADVLSGDEGRDRLEYINSDAGVVVDLSADLETGLQTVSGGDAQGDQATGFEDARGSSFDDLLIGDDAGNRLMGDAGNDTLVGGDGNDDLLGGSGDDILVGGAGNDMLRGGAGVDTFVFNSETGNGNIDRVSDFSVGEDVIQLDSSFFSGLSGGALESAAFAASATGEATTADHRVLYDTNTGALSFDADGVGGADATQFATLQSDLALTEEDFNVLFMLS